MGTDWLKSANLLPCLPIEHRNLPTNLPTGCVYAELFEQTLFMLKGLPELGVLLQVEKDLPALIHKVFGEHGALFRAEDMSQWQKAEARLREALADYAHAARST